MTVYAITDTKKGRTGILPGHLPGRPPAHQTMYDDNRRPVG